MESCLMTYFVLNDELISTCDFNPYLFENIKPVYEVVRVESGIPVFLDEHIERFFKSISLAGIKSNSLTQRRIINSIKVLIETNKLKMGLIKFLFFKQDGDKDFFSAWIAPFTFPSQMQYKTGVEVKLMKGERAKPNTKFANLPVREMADKMIKEFGVYEVLLINNQEIITEGSRSNVFFVKKNSNILFTPNENLVLNGITRIKIIELAINMGADVYESCYYSYELSDFDSAFLTGTSPKILPISKIDNIKLSVTDDIINTLTNKYNNLISDYIKHFSWKV